MRRRSWLGLFWLVALFAFAPAALAVPGGPDPETDGDPGAWLAGLHGGPIRHPSAGSFEVLNSSGVNAASANQVNDPMLDSVQTFPGAVPLVKATQSETSVAVAGSNIVIGYNNSAGVTFSDAAGDESQQLVGGYSVSHDGGKTWQSGLIPPEPGGPPFTFGDPVVRADRAGNFYYASLSWFGVLVAKSIDHGDTWTSQNVAPTFFSASPFFGPDKEWMAIGPDPNVPKQDDIYVTWTQLFGSASRLWMTRSTDGGSTWAPVQEVYRPVASAVMSSSLQASNPVVDPSTGRLYIPFLHFSKTDADDIRVMASDDGGQTLRFLNFNVAGAPDATMFPNVTAGSQTDCGVFGGRRLTIHQGVPTIGRRGLPRWVQATRVLTQPAAAAANGRVFIAISSSTSSSYGVGTGSKIQLLYSPDGGTTWGAPVTVAAATAAEPQHFNPAITSDARGSAVRVVYYVQDASGRIGVDSAVGTVTGGSVSFGKPSHVAAPFDLPPTNITTSSDVNDPTYNYDSATNACYGLGEYLDATQTSAGPVAAWGGDRQLWKEPTGAVIGGVHRQQDVFFGSLQ